MDITIIKKQIINIIKNIDDMISDNFGSIKILFVIKNSISFKVFLPIIRETIHDNHFKIYLTLECNGCFTFPEDKESQFLKYSHYINTKKALFSKWHFIFFSDFSSLYFFRHATTISIPHGYAYGNSHKESNKNNDTSMYSLKTINANNISLAFLSSNNIIEKISVDKTYLVTGSPQSDIFTHKIKPREKYHTLNRYKLNNKNKNIVIYSHWKENSLLNTIDIYQLEQLVKSFPIYNFIINGHILLWKNHDGSVRINPLFLKLTNLDKTHNNLLFLPFLKNSYDISKIADYFIGDNSSYFVEACLVDKPIFYYDHPGFIFEDSQVETLFKKACTPFSSFDALLSIMTDLKDFSDSQKNDRKNVIDFFLFKPGYSTNYIIKFLKTIGRNSGPKSRNWDKVTNYCKMEAKFLTEKEK